jgi:hypothetical protein
VGAESELSNYWSRKGVNEDADGEEGGQEDGEEGYEEGCEEDHEEGREEGWQVGRSHALKLPFE